MRTSTLTFLCLLATAATLSVRPAPSQQPPDVTACHQSAPLPSGESHQRMVIAACSRVIADAALPASIRSAALVRRAILYSLLSDSLLSVRDFEAAIEIDPANTGTRKARAYHHHTSGRPDQAIADYNEAIRLDPKDAEAYRERGDVWLLQKSYDAAIADYRKAIELKPNDPSQARGQCQASASWTNAFFHCLHVADDGSQPADVRAEAQRRLDRMTGRSGTAR